jgi:hypothetical protein
MAELLHTEELLYALDTQLIEFKRLKTLVENPTETI